MVLEKSMKVFLSLVVGLCLFILLFKFITVYPNMLGIYPTLLTAIWKKQLNNNPLVIQGFKA